MIRARESSDNWSRVAHGVLDKARAGHGLPEHIEWALSYLGDKDGSTKIPRDLMGSQSRAVPGMNTDLMFSSANDVWGTPQWLYDALDKEFGFTLDPCSDGTNAKCNKFYSIHDSGLLKDWGTETVFMNPPYSDCEAWMRKAYGAAQEGATVVCLVPSRTDTEWWHRFAMKGEVRLLKGRLKFGDATNSAPFPSAVIVFRPREFRLVAWQEAA